MPLARRKTPVKRLITGIVAAFCIALAMDVWEYSSADGARISQWQYTGNANQRFARQAV